MIADTRMSRAGLQLVTLLALGSSPQLLSCSDTSDASGDQAPTATESDTTRDTPTEAPNEGTGAESASTPSDRTTETTNNLPIATTTMDPGAVDGTTGTDASTIPLEGPETRSTSPGCSSSMGPTSGAYTIEVDGTTRDYIVTLPDGYTPQKPYRLIFAWHGAGGTAQQIADSGYYGLQEKAADSAIFVTGQGLDFEPIPFIVFSGWSNTNERDTNFVRALVGSLRESYCIDEQRIFSVGMSFGGVMTEMIGCGLGDLFRGIAAMSGAGPGPLPPDFPLAVPTLTCQGQVAAWISQGDADPIALPALGAAGRDHWLATNHCQDQGATDAATGCVSYDGCDPGYPVHWCEFTGGHEIPSFASDAIWDFFAAL